MLAKNAKKTALFCIFAASLFSATARADSPLATSPNSSPEIQPLEIRSPARFIPNARLEVGAGVGTDTAEDSWSKHDFAHVLPTNVSDDVRFVRSLTLRGHSLLDQWLDNLEITENDRPWSTTSFVHVPLLASGGVMPYAVIASEQHLVQADLMRFGAGAGAMVRLGQTGKLGVEAVYMGGAGEGTDSFTSELRVMGRLEWGF